MAESIQKVLMRNRPPRVQITYDVETGGAIEQKELPFIVGVFANLSGDSPKNEKPSIKDRRPVEIDVDNFDKILGSFSPGTLVHFHDISVSENTDTSENSPAAIAETLYFKTLDDFSPIELIKRVPVLTERFGKRQALRDLQSRMESDQDFDALIEGVVKNTDMYADFRTTLLNTTPENDDWGSAKIDDAIADVYQPYLGYTDGQKNHLKNVLGYFVALVLVPLSDTPLDRLLIHHIDLLVARLDTELNEILNQIVHDENFQELEASWRGLFYLVSNTETNESLKIKVLNISQDEIDTDLKKSIAFDQSHIFKLIYESEYGTYGGNPFSVLIGDYYFGRSPKDMSLLEKITEVAAGAHAPFIAAASPKLFGLPSFEDLAKPRDLAKSFESLELNQWNAFRNSEDSRYVTLALPQVMLRLPYGNKRLPADGVRFEETVVAPVEHDGDAAAIPLIDETYEESQGAIQPGNCLWGNPAYFLAQRITHAFAVYGWTAAIRGVEGGGLIENLPNLTYRTADGDVSLQCPTVVSITDRREKELNDLGFVAACHCKGTNMAAFFGGQTTNRPKKYLSDAANNNAQLSSRLPYILAASRFAHYVKVLMRDKIGSFSTQASIQSYLTNWIGQYVLLDDLATQEVKAAFPLREARVDVTEIPGRPGSYNAVLFLRPHFQLEELTTSIRLVAQLPG